MGNILLKKVTPHDINQLSKQSLLLSPQSKCEISRADFRFIQRLTITGTNQQQIVWIAQNIRYSKQKFLIKQIDKIILYDNNRIQKSLKQLQLWKNLYEQSSESALFFVQLLYAFQDYQYLYMVYEWIDGYTLDTVLQHYSFSEQQTKYITAVIIRIIDYFHQKNYSLAQLSPEHFIVQKSTGRLKLLQIFNPMPIDVPYNYNIITQPCIYSAPQVLSKNKVLAQSDYYTLGCIIYEMMTQKNPILDQLSHLQTIQRHHIIAQEFQIKKYNLPEGWNPQAADFLVKLLIKNPLYRLGRYGSFQLKYHPWIQNYNWQILHTRLGIGISKLDLKKFAKTNKQSTIHINISQQQKWRLLKDELFLYEFEKYQYHKNSHSQNIELPSTFNIKRKQTTIKQKKSQKYYDDQVSQSEQSQEEVSEQQNQDLQISQQKSMELTSKNNGKAKQRGRGLLNIVKKEDVQ